MIYHKKIWQWEFSDSQCWPASNWWNQS